MSAYMYASIYKLKLRVMAEPEDPPSRYLLGCGRGTSEGVKLLTRDLVHIAIQVCLGLIHLHQQRLLHKDVATRNCLYVSISLHHGVCAVVRVVCPSGFQSEQKSSVHQKASFQSETVRHETIVQCFFMVRFPFLFFMLFLLTFSSRPQHRL